MNVTLQSTQTGKSELCITAEWAEVAADYDELLAAYGKAVVPGFRPGKAPRSLIEQRFRQRIRDDFTTLCGRRLAREALRERQVRIAGPIAVNAVQLEPRCEFSFTAEFVPVPKLEMPDYAGIPMAGATDDERRDEISEWLLAHTPGEAPEVLVRQECERNGQSGARVCDPPPFDALRVAEPRSGAWQAAARRVKLTLILEQIAEAEGIEPDARDVDERIAKVAVENGVQPGELRRKLECEDGVSRLQSLLRCEQTLNYLLSRAVAVSRTEPCLNQLQLHNAN